MAPNTPNPDNKEIIFSGPGADTESQQIVSQNPHPENIQVTNIGAEIPLKLAQNTGSRTVAGPMVETRHDVSAALDSGEAAKPQPEAGPAASSPVKSKEATEASPETPPKIPSMSVEKFLKSKASDAEKKKRIQQLASGKAYRIENGKRVQVTVEIEKDGQGNYKDEVTVKKIVDGKPVIKNIKLSAIKLQIWEREGKPSPLEQNKNVTYRHQDGTVTDKMKFMGRNGTTGEYWFQKEPIPALPGKVQEPYGVPFAVAPQDVRVCREQNEDGTIKEKGKFAITREVAQEKPTDTTKPTPAAPAVPENQTFEDKDKQREALAELIGQEVEKRMEQRKTDLPLAPATTSAALGETAATEAPKGWFGKTRGWLMNKATAIGKFFKKNPEAAVAAGVGLGAVAFTPALLAAGLAAGAYGVFRYIRKINREGGGTTTEEEPVTPVIKTVATSAKPRDERVQTPTETPAPVAPSVGQKNQSEKPAPAEAAAKPPATAEKQALKNAASTSPKPAVAAPAAPAQPAAKTAAAPVKPVETAPAVSKSRVAQKAAPEKASKPPPAPENWSKFPAWNRDLDLIQRGWANPQNHEQLRIKMKGIAAESDPKLQKFRKELRDVLGKNTTPWAQALVQQIDGVDRRREESNRNKEKIDAQGKIGVILRAVEDVGQITVFHGQRIRDILLTLSNKQEGAAKELAGRTVLALANMKNTNGKPVSDGFEVKTALREFATGKPNRLQNIDTTRR